MFSAKPPISPFLVLFFGLFAVSTAAILIRFAQEEDMASLVIAAGRLSVATLALTPPVLLRYRAELAKLAGRDWGLCFLSGVILGVHFATWITSLEYTSVAASVVLVSTNPLFVALLSFPLLGERVGRQVAIGIVLAFAGGILVAVGGDSGEAPTRADPLLGNALAVIGAAAAAGYFIIGRQVRGRLPVIPYIWLVYGAAAVSLSLMAAVSGEKIAGYPSLTYVWVIAMGLVPQLIGHSSYNYALGYLPAAYVSLVVLGEPIGSTLLAIIFLGELPAVLSVVGGAIILMGILIASQQPSMRKVEADEAVV